MAIQTRETLKGYFINGAMPNQEQFSDLIDSFASASDYKVTLAPGTPYYDVPAMTIITLIWFIGTIEANIGVGNSQVDNNVFEVGHKPAGSDLAFNGVLLFAIGRRIYFNGIQPDTVIIILKQ